MFDRYADVVEGLERQQLVREEPPSHVTARRQLKEAGIDVWPGPAGIVSVCPEAVIYRAPKGNVVTAWSEVRDSTGSKVTFYCEAGMPALAPSER